MSTTAGVLAVILAAMLAVSAFLKLSHRPPVVEAYARVGVTERMLNPLALILLLGAAGLVIGLWWQTVAVAAAAGVAAYFLLAIRAHIRTREFASMGPPIVLELLALGALWLSVG